MPERNIGESGSSDNTKKKRKRSEFTGFYTMKSCKSSWKTKLSTESHEKK